MPVENLPPASASACPLDSPGLAAIVTDSPEIFPGKGVKTDIPSGPRAGVLVRLRAVTRKIMESIVAALPAGRRLRNLQLAQQEFANNLKDTMWVLTMPLMKPVIEYVEVARQIDETFARLGRSTNELRQAGGSLHEALEPFETWLRNAPPEALNKLAMVFGGEPGVGATRYLAERGHAERMLMEMEARVNTELTRRIDSAAQEALGAARESLGKGSPPQQIADKIHAAFDSAVPFVKLGALEGSSRTEAIVDRFVATELGGSPETLPLLLANMRPEDLKRLHTTLVVDDEEYSPPLAGAAADTLAAVRGEIEGRVERMEHELINEAESFNSRYSGRSDHPPAKIDRGAFIQDLSAVGNLARELETHCATYKVTVSINLNQPYSLIRERINTLLTSGDLDLKGLSPRDLKAVSTAAERLGGPATLVALCRQQLATLRTAQHDPYLNSLYGFVEKLGSGADPRSLLGALDRLEQNSTSMLSVTQLLPPDDELEDAQSRQTSLLTRVVQYELPDQLNTPTARGNFARALRDPQTEALFSALHVGARLASDAHEPTLSHRFANMARLLSEVIEAVDDRLSPPPEAALTERPGGAQYSARASLLSKEGRQAFQDLYALTLPTEGAPSLRGDIPT